MIFYPKSWGKKIPSFIVGYPSVNFSSPCPKTRYSFSRKNSIQPLIPQAHLRLTELNSSRYENSTYPSHKHYRTWNDRKSTFVVPQQAVQPITQWTITKNLLLKESEIFSFPFSEEFQQQPQLLEQV